MKRRPTGLILTPFASHVVPLSLTERLHVLIFFSHLLLHALRGAAWTLRKAAATHYLDQSIAFCVRVPAFYFPPTRLGPKSLGVGCVSCSRNVFLLFVFPCFFLLERLGVYSSFLQREKDGLDTLRIVGFLFFLLLLCFLLSSHWRLIPFTKEESKSAWLGGAAGCLPTYLAIVRILIYPSRRPLLIFCWQCRWLYHYYYYYYYYFYHQNLRPCYYLVLSACLGCSVFGGR